MNAQKHVIQDTRSKNKKRMAYALAASAAVAPATSEAAVVYSGIQDLNVVAGLGSQPIQFDTDPYVDVRLKNYVFLNGNYQGLTVSFGPGKVAGFEVVNGSNVVDYVSALSPGTLVDGTSAGPDFKGLMAYGAINPNAQFNNIVDGYIGLSFPIGGNTEDVLHFAWMRVSIDNAVGTFIVRDWAWEDEAGVAITVGDTGASTPAAGDFNQDGLIDGRDFLAWQQGDSPTPFSATDLATWQGAYVGGPLTASVAAVPEPVTLGLLAAGSAGLLLMRRLRQR